MSEDKRVRTGYEEVDVVIDSEGIIAIISKRIGGPPIHTIAVFKSFDRDGTKEKSSFFSHKQVPAVQRVLSIAQARARELEDKAMTEFNANGRAQARR